MSLPDLAGHAQRLRELHGGAEVLLLANAWDVATAKEVVSAGFPVVATSSAAVAKSLGETDDDSMAPDVAFGAVRRIAAAVDVPVTADIEAGYRLDGAELVERLLAAGAVGCNLEDTDHHGDGVLVDAEAQARRLAEVKAAGRAAGVDIVLNARVDAFARRLGTPEEQLEETLRRARLYLDAGADCVYPIGVADEAFIGSVVESTGAPVNVLLRPGAPTVARLQELGVARASVGSGLFGTAVAAFSDAARRLTEPE